MGASLGYRPRKPLYVKRADFARRLAAIMGRYTLSVLLCCCALPSVADGLTQAGNTLVQADSVMDKDIMAQGNDTHAMQAMMAETGLGFSVRRKIFMDFRDVYEHLPPGKSPGNILSLYTEYAATSSAGDFGVTYGVWNSKFIDDSIQLKSDLFYSYFVFGFNSGLWTAKWSPRGAPRYMYHEYLRLWRRPSVSDPWRVTGSFVVERLAAQPNVPDKSVAVMATPATGKRLDLQAARGASLEGDRQISAIAEQRGERMAYIPFAAADMRLLSSFESTIIGADELKARSTGDVALVKLRPVDALVSQGKDLICTYGLEYQASDVAAVKPIGSYVHVWRQEANGPKLILVFVVKF